MTRWRRRRASSYLAGPPRRRAIAPPTRHRRARDESAARRCRDRDRRVGADRRPRLVDDAKGLELGDEDDVASRDRHERLALGLARAVGPRDVGVDEGDEVGVVSVQEVGGPGAVALVGKLQRALDDVALGLDPYALAAELHARIIGARPDGR